MRWEQFDFREYIEKGAVTKWNDEHLASGFNQIVSDETPVTRHLPEVRHESCINPDTVVKTV